MSDNLNIQTTDNVDADTRNLLVQLRVLSNPCTTAITETFAEVAEEMIFGNQASGPSAIIALNQLLLARDHFIAALPAELWANCEDLSSELEV